MDSKITRYVVIPSDRETMTGNAIGFIEIMRGKKSDVPGEEWKPDGSSEMTVAETEAYESALGWLAREFGKLPTIPNKVECEEIEHTYDPGMDELAEAIEEEMLKNEGLGEEDLPEE